MSEFILNDAIPFFPDDPLVDQYLPSIVGDLDSAGQEPIIGALRPYLVEWHRVNVPVDRGLLTKLNWNSVKLLTRPKVTERARIR